MSGSLPRANSGASLLAFAMLAGAGCRAPVVEETQDTSAVKRDRLSGSLTTRYKGRWSTDDEDHDLLQLVDVNYDDSDRSGVSGHLLAQAFWDIDGTQADDPFFGLQDTFDSRVTTRLYHAYVDLHGYELLPRLRIGRQQIYETPLTLYFDGVQVETRRLGDSETRVGVYGGIPTHPYESSSSGDSLAGVYAKTKVWKGATFRADWMHLEDDSLTGAHQDDLFGAQLTQNIESATHYSYFTTTFTALESEKRDLRVSASHFDTENELSIDASYYELFETQQDLAVPLDPFYSTLFELFPYYQLTLSTSKTWRDYLLLFGLDVRRVDDTDDVGEFNRDFERYYFTGNTAELLPAHTRLSFTGEVWKSDGNDIQTWGIDASGTLEEDLDFSLGSYYSLFKYDYFLGEERDDVRTYFLNLVYSKHKDTRWSVRYEYEDNDFDDFHRLRLGFTWFF